MARFSWRTASLLLAAVLCPLRAASASDAESLSKLLLPVDMAQNFVLICSVHNPAFLQATSGVHGTMLWYAQHMKQEVIASLPGREARAVMVEAADVAKAEALKVVHTMASGGVVDAAQMNAWCEASAKPFIEATIGRHDTQHALLDEMIAKAKQ